MIYPATMNAFATLSLIYFLFTTTSSSILYYSFRNKLDASVVYFLISELCMTITCAVVFLTNVELIDINPASIGIPNFGALAAELSILFSILSIRKSVNWKWFGLAITALVLLTIFLESIRSPSELKIVVLINVITLTGLFAINYLACRFKFFPLLATNGFMRLFGWFEFGLVIYGLIRLLASLFGAPIIPRETPTNLAVLVYAIYLVIGTFRYMSYIGFRMTWVDPMNPSENFLNKPLVKAIEEKNQFLQGLIASNRVIGISALASSLAHQLSQPLTTIAFRAETTRRDLIESGQSSHSIASLDEISLQSGKLADLVHNLRRLFSARSHQFKGLNLQKVANEIIEIIKPTLESKKIALITNYQSNPMVFGDSIQLQQVLINIVNNAIDALSLDEKGKKEITIAITENEQFAILTISDSGPGIDQKIYSSVFELYNTTKEDGLGVGLWLSKTIIERHKGQITALNHPRSGAIFEIEIPLYCTEMKAQ